MGLLDPLDDPNVECVGGLCTSYSRTGVPSYNPYAGNRGRSPAQIYREQLSQPVNYMVALAQVGRITAPVASPYFVPGVLGAAAGIAGAGLAAPAAYVALDYGTTCLSAGVETYVPGGIAAASQVPSFISEFSNATSGGFSSSVPMSPGGVLGWAAGYTYYNGHH